MSIKRDYEINIRAMVEFLLQYGDISKSNRAGQNSERALLGASIHRKLQKEFAGSKEYNKEAYVRYTYVKDEITLTVNGRADGYFYEDNILHVDEIKTVEVDLSHYEESDLVHLAQAMCYTYILASESKSDCVINIIYYNIFNDERKSISKFFAFSEIEEMFINICESYISWIRFDISRHEMLFKELESYQFPFPEYREGQRQLAVSVYKAITNKHKLYVQAPTGIGKTISVLFPSLKNLGEGKGSKIFFLTSRNAGILAPQDTLTMIHGEVPHLSFVTLTAKEKICPNNTNCDPETCVYARGHFDRVNKAVFESINRYRLFTRELIEQLAEEYKVCPFEFGLDLSLWTDVIIGDYNYLFDPMASLKRFFSDGGDYIFLVDEAHNLQDRTRDMYTQRLSKKSFSDLKKKFKDISNGKNVYKHATNTVKLFNDIKKNMEDSKYLVTESYDQNMYMQIISLCSSLGEYISNEGTDDNEVMELYLNCLFFIKLLEIYDNNFCYYTTIDGSDVVATVYLANPSKIIGETLKKGRSTILFSGTLEPIQFYYKSLGGYENDKLICIPSPFPPENKLVLISRDVATTYKRRQFFYKTISEYIMGLTSLEKGNFLVFFSSYKYITDVVSYLPLNVINNTVVIQPSSQDPAEREQFLKDFLPNPQGIRIGLCVLGGIYSEGIDLVGDRLSGVIVVGVGLPQVCLERDIIRAVYDRADQGSGFLNAYVYPGLNKVLQAAGRVIRTDTDRGFIVLLDERFSERSYLSLIPQDMDPKIVEDVDQCMDEIKKFIYT